MTPNACEQNAPPATLAIVGEDLFVDVRVDLISPQGVRVLADFTATLSSGAAEEHALDAVTWIDNGTLYGQPPVGLPLGTNDIGVVRPDGIAAELTAAATIRAGTGGPCVDVEGDTLAPSADSSRVPHWTSGASNLLALEVLLMAAAVHNSHPTDVLSRGSRV